MLRMILTTLALLLALPVAAEEARLMCTERSNMLQAMDQMESDSDHLSQKEINVDGCGYDSFYLNVAVNEYYDARRVYYNFETGLFFTFMPMKPRGENARIRYVLLNAGRLDEFCMSAFQRTGFHGSPEPGAKGYVRPPSHSLTPHQSAAQYPVGGLESSEFNSFQLEEMGCPGPY